MLRQSFILGLQYDNKLPLTRKFSLPYDKLSTLGFHKPIAIKIKPTSQNLFLQKDNTCAMKTSIQHFATKKMCHVTKVHIHDVWPSISFKPSSIMVGSFLSSHTLFITTHLFMAMKLCIYLV